MKTKTSSKRNAAARSSLARGSDSSPTLEECVMAASARGARISFGLTPRDKDIEALKSCCLAIETCTSPRMVRATLDFLNSKYGEPLNPNKKGDS